MKKSKIKDLTTILAQLGLSEVDTMYPDSRLWSPEIAAAAQEQIRERKTAIFRQYDSGEITEQDFTAAIESLNAELPLLYQQIAKNMPS